MSTRFAIAVSSDSALLEHFGHARTFAVYELTHDGLQPVESRRTDAFCGSEQGRQSLENVISLLEGCRAIICAAIGPCGREGLEQAGMEAIEFEGTVEEALGVIAQRGLPAPRPAALFGSQTIRQE